MVLIIKQCIGSMRFAVFAVIKNSWHTNNFQHSRSAPTNKDAGKDTGTP